MRGKPFCLIGKGSGPAVYLATRTELTGRRKRGVPKGEAALSIEKKAWKTEELA